jgi:hypothetical protein
MGIFDVFARTVAVTVLLFIVSFLVLSLLGFWLTSVAPFRHSLLLALLSVACAGVPMLLIYLTRAATGAATNAGARARYFFAFAALSATLALVFASLIVSGQIRL